MRTVEFPWPVVTSIELFPVGPVRPEVFGLRWEEPDDPDDWWQTHPVVTYQVQEPRRLAQLREALGSLVDSPTGLRRPDKHPFYQALCSVHRALTEEGL